MIVLHLPWISLTILSFVAIMDEEVAHWQLAITPKRLAVRPASAAIISTVVSITLGNTNLLSLCRSDQEIMLPLLYVPCNPSRVLLRVILS